MSFVSRFIVLIESRRLPRAVVATVTAISLLLSGFGFTAAHAAPGNGNGNGNGSANGHSKRGDKVARDLRQEATRFGPPQAAWARDVNGARQVQAIVVTDGEPRRLTSFAAAYAGAVELLSWERFAVPTTDGTAAIISMVGLTSDCSHLGASWET